MKDLKLKESIVHLLFMLFQEENTHSLIDYPSVNDFYAMLGYDFESETLLNQLNVYSTSDLQELFLNYNGYLNGDMIEDEWFKYLKGNKKWIN